MTRMRSPTDDRIVDDGLPSDLPDGSSILVAMPSALPNDALTLRLADRYAEPAAGQLVLTTAVDGDQTIEQYRDIAGDEARGRLGVVDASDDPGTSAPFQEHPIVSLPNPSELTRIVLALQQLESTLSSEPGPVNVVVRSLSPMLVETRLEQLRRVVDQLAERQRSAGGVAVFGLEYTRHDSETMAGLRTLVDAVVWVEETARGLALDLE